MGLTTRSFAELLRQAGFVANAPQPLTADRFGPPEPPLWRWKPRRSAPARARDKGRQPSPPQAAAGNPFAELADLLR